MDMLTAEAIAVGWCFLCQREIAFRGLDDFLDGAAVSHCISVQALL